MGIWDGAFNPRLVKRKTTGRPAHGWDQFEVSYDKVGDFVYVTVKFDHRDICFDGEDAPSNGKPYTYEVELESGETFAEFKEEASKDFETLMNILNERATVPFGPSDVKRIQDHRPLFGRGL